MKRPLAVLAAFWLTGCSSPSAPPASPTPSPVAKASPSPPGSVPFFGGRAWPQKQQAVLCVLEGASRQPCLLSFQLENGRPAWKKTGRYGVLDGGAQELFTWSLAGPRELRLQRLDPSNGRAYWECPIPISNADYDTLSCESHPQGSDELAVSWSIQRLPMGGPARPAPQGPQQGAVVISISSGKWRVAKAESAPVDEASATSPAEDGSLTLGNLVFRAQTRHRPQGFRMDRELQALDGHGPARYQFQLPDVPDLQRMIAIP
jgi:hypothetical protein